MIIKDSGSKIPKKKVLLVNYTGKNGGGALDSYELSKALLESGESVVAVISSECTNLSYWKLLPFEKLILIKTYSSKKEFFFRTICFFACGRWKLFFALKNYELEFIVCPMVALWTHMINQVFHNVPVCVINHDPKPHSGDKNITFLNLFGMQKIYYSAKAIFVHSQAFIHYVEKKYHKRENVFYIPLGRHSFYKYIKNKKVSIHYDAEKINFLFFGRIEDYKGLDILAEAYKQVTSLCDNVSLTIAGSGNFKKYKTAYSNLPNITIFNRWIEDCEVESFFNGPNIVLIVPYIDATQSGALLIALDYSIPVIASNTGGLREQITEGKTGILVTPGKAEELSQAMIKFAKNNELFDILTIGANEKLQELEWDTIAKELCRKTRTVIY
ncbi:glycosyltransferase family 4 protein [Hungatella hathewayi]|uniref:Uncharacterized protein n=1 Tax=Hungatella hathewayi WAL-18680 TaxID=742737 RepID=G5IB54_9FIRM|nr:glycosyltransferase [Hungatella hathewayi]EHI61369.1 hypothetical protein HMPREF9473_00731 [ [Hungatella hathewayi WAL-18680]